MPIYSPHQEKLANQIDKNSSSKHWRDWKWQLKHSIRDIATFEKLLEVSFTDEERVLLNETLENFPLAVTPYYLSIIDRDDFRNDPVFKQSVPDPSELVIGEHDMSDPLHEDADSPAPCITHRYPDRVLFHISNVCSMYCRHCTRKRKVSDVDSIPDRATVEQGLDYIRSTPQVRDVLLSGGDPLMLSDDYLDWVLGELGKIEHVELVRIGTRMPVVLPYRITPDRDRRRGFLESEGMSMSETVTAHAVRVGEKSQQPDGASVRSKDESRGGSAARSLVSNHQNHPENGTFSAVAVQSQGEQSEFIPILPADVSAGDSAFRFLGSKTDPILHVSYPRPWNHVAHFAAKRGENLENQNWRRGRDSNPRNRLRFTRFPSVLNRPL